MRFVVSLALSVLLTAPAAAAESGGTFENPVIAGFHPDPSICRVGDDYYVVHSSFEYFPGVPIFHSRDLVHWEQIGHCLTRPSQLRLKGTPASGGIFAPTLRWHDGVFYMVTTNVYGGGNFYVTAADPAGPWSEPVWLDREGIDPSFLFDDDGTVYYTRHVGMGDGYIGQATLNLETGQLGGPLKEIWRGTGGVWPEGPHLYKTDGRYYLVIAEGGTSYGHMVTVARSDSPWGPFTPSPNNPILTHANRPDNPIQATGHADLVETPAGWWAVCLGVRPQGGRLHHLGRETFLAPVAWTDGWPVIGDEGKIEPVMPAPNLPSHRWAAPPARDEFDGPTLGLAWNFVRNPYDADWSLAERPGWLRLRGSAVTLSDQDSPAFVGRRQTAFACRAAAQVSFEPEQENEEAGLVIRGNDENHFELGISRRDGRRQVFFRCVLRGKVVEPVSYQDAPEGEIVLSIAAGPTSYNFFCQSRDGPPVPCGTAKTADLASEKIGGFTGVYIGMYATGNGRKCTVPADFAWFEYHAQEQGVE